MSAERLVELALATGSASEDGITVTSRGNEVRVERAAGCLDFRCFGREDAVRTVTLLQGAPIAAPRRELRLEIVAIRAALQRLSDAETALVDANPRRVQTVMHEIDNVRAQVQHLVDRWPDLAAALLMGGDE